MNALRWIRDVADYLGGCADAPPPGVPIAAASWVWALWWGALTLLIVMFCGQATKFIYVDF
jgi:hypothetical protein